jgi:hypothetical protein
VCATGDHVAEVTVLGYLRVDMERLGVPLLGKGNDLFPSRRVRSEFEYLANREVIGG